MAITDAPIKNPKPVFLPTTTGIQGDTGFGVTVPNQQDPVNQLANLNKQIADRQKQIDLINAKIKALKDPGTKGAKNVAAHHKFMVQKAALSAQLSPLTKSMGALKTQQAKVQNTVWTNSGQYENLLKGTERDAYMAINSLFKQYDLGSLAGKIYDYVKNGYSADTISILLQDTKEYKDRFSANEARKKAGLPVLSPGEYLSAESSYRQIMQSAGLPPGFYDQHTDFDNFLSKDVSPTEVQSRVDMATQATILSNPDYRKALNQMGISDNDMTAYFLDSNKALPFLQKNAATAAIGAQALAQGLQFDQAYAGELATKGITGAEAQQGYANISAELGSMKNLGSIYGEQWGQRESEEATFEGLGTAAEKKRKLQSQERGAFSGSAGAGRAGLAGQGGAH